MGHRVAAAVGRGQWCTLAHRRWAAGLSAGKGVTTFEKLPLESVVALAATWACVSQKRLIDSLARKYDPVAVMRVLGPAAAKSRTMLAAVGVGVTTGDGVGIGVGVGAELGGGVGVGVGVGGGKLMASARTNH